MWKTGQKCSHSPRRLSKYSLAKLFFCFVISTQNVIYELKNLLFWRLLATDVQTISAVSFLLLILVHWLQTQVTVPNQVINTSAFYYLSEPSFVQGDSLVTALSTFRSAALRYSKRSPSRATPWVNAAPFIAPHTGLLAPTRPLKT